MPKIDLTGFAEMIGVFLGLALILYTRRRWLWVGYIMTAAGLLTYMVWLVPHKSKIPPEQYFLLI